MYSLFRKILIYVSSYCYRYHIQSSLTKLMLMADKRGSKAYNGRDIMFYNCFEAFQWWTDIKIDEEYEKKLFKIWEDLIYNI